MPVAAVASPSPELIDRLQALGVQPHPVAAAPAPTPAPTPASFAAAEADQDLLAGALALLLFLALVFGIYFGLSALFGGSDEPPKAPEYAPLRSAPPALRPPPVEDRSPPRGQWSQPGAGYPGPGTSGSSGLNTTSRMPGARLDRPGDPPPGPSYGQPYYQYGTVPYGTRQ
jgi:hypothetical protein